MNEEPKVPPDTRLAVRREVEQEMAARVLRIRQRPLFYKLEGETPVPCGIDDMSRGAGYEDRWHLQTTVYTLGVIPIRVSTVFLGIDHAFGQGPPVLFETMMFGGPFGGKRGFEYQRRYMTMAQAKLGHARACKLAAWPWWWAIRHAAERYDLQWRMRRLFKAKGWTK